MKLFENKYRIKSARLKDWDYSSDGYYFVTICTKNKENFFGEIRNKEMFLSPVGAIAEKFWQEIPEHFTNVKLDVFVVMPNHIHGIVIIDNWNEGVETPRRGVSTVDRNPHHKSEWKPNSLGSIINQFKSVCTKRVREINPDFAWQPRFHDHIILDDKEHNNI